MTKDSDRDDLVMSKELKRQVDKMTTFQRRYCEYRGRGLNQPDSAKKAGSKADGRGPLGRVGYNIEATVEGAKDFISYLQTCKARAACVEEVEIIEMLRSSYRMAMDSGKYGDANKAAELLGNHIGMFGKRLGQQEGSSQQEGSKVKNNVEAFKDHGETHEERSHKIGKMLNLVKGNNNNEPKGGE